MHPLEVCEYQRTLLARLSVRVDGEQRGSCSLVHRHTERDMRALSVGGLLQARRNVCTPPQPAATPDPDYTELLDGLREVRRLVDENPPALSLLLQ